MSYNRKGSCQQQTGHSQYVKQSDIFTTQIHVRPVTLAATSVICGTLVQTALEEIPMTAACGAKL